MKPKKDGIYCRYIKRLLDIACSLLALIVLSPILIVVAILVRVKLGSPVLFAQERIGKDEKPFVMFKFRSMSNAKNSKGELLPDTQRIGKFGKFLRSSSLDELPALINILKGDMSVVGPRPLPTLYKPYFYESERIDTQFAADCLAWLRLAGAMLYRGSRSLRLIMSTLTMYPSGSM